jgi:ferredoxin
MKQPKINQDLCIGCGTCSALCGQTFATNGPTATVINPTGNSEVEINTTIASCPTQAISWEESKSD